MRSEISKIQAMFYEKFGKIPLITFENTNGYGENFLIWKEKTIFETLNFYKMGKTLVRALAYVDRLIQIPNGVIVFDNKRQYELYDMQVELIKLKDENE